MSINSPQFIVLQSGPATGKSLLLRLVMRATGKRPELSTITMSASITKLDLHKSITACPTDLVIIDEVNTSDARTMHKLLRLLQDERYADRLFVLQTQSILPQYFYDLRPLVWELNPLHI